MIDVVTPDLAHVFAADLEAMHQLRYRVFKERLDWAVDAVNGAERDEFDDLASVYLLARDDNEMIVGTWRLLPTTGPYMLRNVFPALLEGYPAPCSPRIWEGSRLAVDGGRLGREGLASINVATTELFCGLVEFCLSQGIEEVLTVYDARVARLLPRIGCEPRWHSDRHQIGNTATIAGRFEVSERVLTNIRTSAGMTSSVLRQIELSRTPQAA